MGSLQRETLYNFVAKMFSIKAVVFDFYAVVIVAGFQDVSTFLSTARYLTSTALSVLKIRAYSPVCDWSVRRNSWQVSFSFSILAAFSVPQLSNKGKRKNLLFLHFPFRASTSLHLHHSSTDTPSFPVCPPLLPITHPIFITTHRIPSLSICPLTDFTSIVDSAFT